MEYLSIKEASEKTNKDEKTIRRLIKKPESRDYVRLKHNKLYINSKYLYRIYQPTYLSTQEDIALSTQVDEHLSTQVESQSIEEVNNDKDKADIEYLKVIIEGKEKAIEILSNQVDKMSRQLENKDTTISQLIERTREQNIIIQSIQDKLAKQLPNPKSEPNSQVLQKPSHNKVDMLLIGVAILASIVLLTFTIILVLAYLNR